MSLDWPWKPELGWWIAMGIMQLIGCIILVRIDGRPGGELSIETGDGLREGWVEEYYPGGPAMLAHA